jgi:hypothetical protein
MFNRPKCLIFYYVLGSDSHNKKVVLILNNYRICLFL